MQAERREIGMHNLISVSAGRFYPSDPGLLLEQLEACYRHPLGPGELPLSHSSLIGTGQGKPPLASFHLTVRSDTRGPLRPMPMACWRRGRQRITGCYPGLLCFWGPTILREVLQSLSPA